MTFLRRSLGLASLTLALAAGGAACTEAEPGGDGERATTPSCPNAIVTGTIVREKTQFTYNDEVPFSPEAHAVIELRRYQGEDGSAPFFLETDVPVTGLPFDFVLCGDAAEGFADRGTLLLSVEVYNHAGRDAEVGDLVSEDSHPLEGKTVGETVLVSGLESCGSPDAGGFCL